MERLQKILAQYGVCSRREAERMIEAGRVAVDGVVATIGQSAHPDWNLITVDGKPIADKQKKVYILLNKPRGYVSTVSDELGRKTVMDLIKDCPERVYPVGRLDLNTDGFLLLTNDGELTKRLTHPSYEVPKHYRVRVSGTDIDEAVEKLKAGVTFEGVRYGKAEVKVIDRDEEKGSALLAITIHEGKKREIRNMCKAVELSVLRLTRIGEGSLRLGGLKSGEWRYLDKSELKLLSE